MDDLPLVLRDALCLYEALRKLDYPPEAISLMALGDGRLCVRLDENDDACAFVAGVRPTDLDDTALAALWREAVTAWNNASYEQSSLLWEDFKTRYNLASMMMLLTAKKLYPRKNKVFVVKNQPGEA